MSTARIPPTRRHATFVLLACMAVVGAAVHTAGRGLSPASTQNDPACRQLHDLLDRVDDCDPYALDLAARALARPDACAKLLGSIDARPSPRLRRSLYAGSAPTRRSEIALALPAVISLQFDRQAMSPRVSLDGVRVRARPEPVIRYVARGAHDLTIQRGATRDDYCVHLDECELVEIYRLDDRPIADGGKLTVGRCAGPEIIVRDYSPG